MNRKVLGQQALRMALRARGKAGADLISPVCPYDVADHLGVGVLRPFGRRNFTCGHELGHHVFGHGFNLDNVISSENADCYNYGSSEEFLANSFSGALLMPSLGIRRAFVSRGWSLSHPTPFEALSIAAEFGVGYSTLIHHMWHNLALIGAGTARHLLKESPQSIRSEYLGYESKRPLVVVDEQWLAKTIDLEAGMEVILPARMLPGGDALAPVEESSRSDHFTAIRPGIIRAASPSAAIFMRIMPAEYEGLAKYRHLERDDETETC
jgi:hypothetical protein